MTIFQGQVEANGLTFGYLDTGGDGPLAMCVHGFPDSPWTWQHLLPELATAGYRAVAPWNRGYAPTSLPADGCFQSGALGSDVNALHEALGGDGEAVIIGHDWGAMATYTAAGSAPDRWRRAVTLAVPPVAVTASSLLDYEQLKRSFYFFVFQLPMAEGLVAADDLAFLDHLWADWSPGLDPALRTEAAEHVKDALRDPANLTAALGTYRAMFGNSPRSPEYDAVDAAAFGPMPVPTLYLHGVDDAALAVPDRDAVVTALGAEGSRCELVDDAGHFLQLEQPDQVNTLIVDFLAS
jgi:pimeloyl-ACP methyl ester carboxylesterase